MSEVAARPGQSGSGVRVGVVMGSQSDLAKMSKARETLSELGIECELRVISAHRTPEEAAAYARNAEERGLCVIIAGAGGRGSSGRHNGSLHRIACDRRSHSIRRVGRVRRAVRDSDDAVWRACGYGSDRWGCQCRDTRSSDHCLVRRGSEAAFGGIPLDDS